MNLRYENKFFSVQNVFLLFSSLVPLGYLFQFQPDSREHITAVDAKTSWSLSTNQSEYTELCNFNELLHAPHEFLVLLTVKVPVSQCGVIKLFHCFLPHSSHM